MVGMGSGVRLWDRACNIWWKIVFIDVLRHANTSFFHVPVKSEEVRRRGGISGGLNGANGSAQIGSRRSKQNLPMENWSKHTSANGKLEQLQTQGVLVPGPRPNIRSQFSRVLFSASPVTCQVPQSEKVEQALQM